MTIAVWLRETTASAVYPVLIMIMYDCDEALSNMDFYSDYHVLETSHSCAI